MTIITETHPNVRYSRERGSETHGIQPEYGPKNTGEIEGGAGAETNRPYKAVPTRI